MEALRDCACSHRPPFLDIIANLLPDALRVTMMAENLQALGAFQMDGLNKEIGIVGSALGTFVAEHQALEETVTQPANGLQQLGQEVKVRGPR